MNPQQRLHDAIRTMRHSLVGRIVIRIVLGVFFGNEVMILLALVLVGRAGLINALYLGTLFGLFGGSFAAMQLAIIHVYGGAARKMGEGHWSDQRETQGDSPGGRHED